MKIKKIYCCLNFFICIVLLMNQCSGFVYAQANEYPNRPIKLIVPFPPGGTLDIISRILMDPFAKSMGQPLIIENKGGGGGSIGANETAKALPDGYSLGVVTSSTAAVNPAVNPRLGYNPIVDFTPIINIAATPNLLAINPTFPANDYHTFFNELRLNPSKYSYASAGTGAIGNVLVEVYKGITGLSMTHIPYRGAGPALVDTISGHVLIVVDNLPSALSFIKDNKLIPIVVSGSRRLNILPDVPTFRELGLEAANLSSFYGFYGPRGLSKEIVDKVSMTMKKILEDPAIRQKIENTGAVIVANSPEDFQTQIKSEYDMYLKIVKNHKITKD